MKAIVFSDKNVCGYNADILSYSAMSYMIDAASSEGDVVLCPPSLSGIDNRAGVYESADDLCKKLAGCDCVILFEGAFPSLSKDTIDKFTDKGCGFVLRKGNMTAAYCIKPSDIGAELSSLEPFEIPDGEWMRADSAENVYAIQESMRRRINLGLMKKGVYLVDPSTTHVSPKAEIGAGTRLLPGCLIYGETVIGRGCVIGPNSMITDAEIGDGTSVNASQVNKSTVGCDTTVGPFAYIRPGCAVGNNCRIGDFVELKNSNIGDKTKVSHLTYIGDSDFGQNINVGCGVVTVNYDGMHKYRTTVEDNAFVGCNVNLVAPVKVGQGSFIAAGSTITDEVSAGALAIARERQSEKPGWADKRREDKKLK